MELNTDVGHRIFQFMDAFINIFLECMDASPELMITLIRFKPVLVITLIRFKPVLVITLIRSGLYLQNGLLQYQNVFFTGVVVRVEGGGHLMGQLIINTNLFELLE